MRLLMIFTSYTSRQNSKVIRESLSVTTLLGVLKRYSIYLKNSLAKSTIVESSRVGINRAYFVTQHTIVSILSYSSPFRLKTGNPVIQSKEISLKGEFQRSVGIGKGYSWPYGLYRYTTLP